MSMTGLNVNKIAVVPRDRILGKTIAENVVSALDRSPELDLGDVDVRVEDGVVSLSGSVPTQSLYRSALDAARYTRGVIQIEDRIVVQA